jgi:hypothetical protein
VHVLGPAKAPVGAGAIEGGCCVGDDVGLESQISGHPNRGRNAVIGRQPNDDQALDSPPSQVRFQSRANEGAIDPFAVNRLALLGNRLGLGFAARGSRSKGTGGARGVVVYVNDRGRHIAPDPQEQRDTGFSREIVARSPRRIVEPILHIDHDQRGLTIKWFQFFSRCGLTPAMDFACASAAVQNRDGGIGIADGLI